MNGCQRTLASSQGPGFYIWAYKKSSVECAKIYLQQEESRWLESQNRFRDKKITVKEPNNLFEVLREETPKKKEQPKKKYDEYNKPSLIFNPLRL